MKDDVRILGALLYCCCIIIAHACFVTQVQCHGIINNSILRLIRAWYLLYLVYHQVQYQVHVSGSLGYVFLL